MVAIASCQRIMQTCGSQAMSGVVGPRPRCRGQEVYVVEEAGEEFDPSWLIVGGGAVALADEHGLKACIGREVGAGLADRFEAAVKLCGSLAPAVAQKPVVDLVAESSHRH